MHNRTIDFVGSNLVLLLLLGAAYDFSAATSLGQARNSENASSIAAASASSEEVANELVLDSAGVTVRHIIVNPQAFGVHYWHPGGSIILLREYPFKIPIPLSAGLEAGLKVGDVIPVAPGDYVLENPTSRPLDFLSIEKKP